MKDPWSKFFWSDWEADQGLRLCSLAAQGLWMRMLCVCARHEPKGYLAINGNPLAVEDIARLAGVTETEVGTLMEELDRNGVFSRNRSGCIYSRRMVRDEKRSKEGRKWKKQGLAQVTEMTGEKSGPSRGPARGPSPHIPEARSQNRDIHSLPSEAHSQTTARGRSLPDDWRPTDKHLQEACKLGRDAEWMARQADAMRTWALANRNRQVARKADWDLTFLGWMRRESEKHPQAQTRNTGMPSRPDASTVDWPTFVRRFLNGQTWPSSLGPQPGYAGCRAPADVLRAHGFGPPGVAQAGAAP